MLLRTKKITQLTACLRLEDTCFLTPSSGGKSVFVCVSSQICCLVSVTKSVMAPGGQPAAAPVYLKLCFVYLMKGCVGEEQGGSAVGWRGTLMCVFKR